jgi:hypothetical protein
MDASSVEGALLPQKSREGDTAPHSETRCFRSSSISIGLVARRLMPYAPL